MLSPPQNPRKRRTRQHIIADLSVHHVEGLILEEGHIAQRQVPDYGRDLAMYTFDNNGYLEPGSVYFQLKASDALLRVGADFASDVDIRDYNLWMNEENPVILVLFDALRRRAYWIAFQAYFVVETRKPKRGAKTIRVRVPRRQLLDRKAIETIRRMKPEERRPTLGIFA